MNSTTFGRAVSLGVCLSFMLVIFNQCASAEIQCVVDISYRWQPSTAETSKPEKASKVPESEGTPEASPEAQPTGNIVHVALVQRRSETQELAKQLLSPEVDRSKVKAGEYCRRDHENFSGCVGSKFQINASILSAVDFSARRELEKSITEDCRKAQGSCLGVTAGEPVCAEVAVKPTPTAAAAPDKAADKKKK